jgi:hypothetical protein
MVLLAREREREENENGQLGFLLWHDFGLT